MKNLRMMLILGCALGFVSAMPAAAVAEGAPTMAVDDDGAYATGVKALDDHRWNDAVTAFDQAASGKGKRADAALYWKAYALNKLGRADLAGATCGQLGTLYNQSRWNADCRALTLPYYRTGRQDGDAGSGEPGKDPDGELKLLALNSLMNRDPAQAIPLLQGVLAGNQPVSVKQHALFVLAQGRSPEAQTLMRELVMGKMGPEMQRESIQSAGLFEGRRMNDALLEVYRTTADVKAKRAVVQAFFLSADDARLVELARGEKNMEMKRAIVSQLSLMQGNAAKDYMLELLK